MYNELEIELFGLIMVLFLCSWSSECILVVVGVIKSDGTFLSVY